MADKQNGKNPADAVKKFEADSRIACRYGLQCYQKNPQHHAKFKHPPKIEKQKADDGMNFTPCKKRKLNDSDSESNNEASESGREALTADSSAAIDSILSSDASDENTCDSSNAETPSVSARSPTLDADSTIDDESLEGEAAATKEEEKGPEDLSTSMDHDFDEGDVKDKILKLFLVQMPKDFYKFYEFCCKLSPNDPSSSLNVVDLQLVGPYDVLNGKIADVADDDVRKYLKHWRYFYDPPEFQTILKGNDKDGLHYGYWRDTCDENPVFVARNSVNVGYKFETVAANIFGAVLVHIEEKLKAANPFQKPSITRTLQSLKRFATDNSITLEKNSAVMRVREREVVAKTINTIGIVVPFNKKNQMGYRNPCITDSQFLKIVRILKEDESDEERSEYLETVETVMRYATIAADECDFGTPLKVGQDFFASGVDCLAKHALVMLNLAYQVLKRPQFAAIASAHIKDRKKSCDLSVL